MERGDTPFARVGTMGVKVDTDRLSKLLQQRNDADGLRDDRVKGDVESTFVHAVDRALFGASVDSGVSEGGEAHLTLDQLQICVRDRRGNGAAWEMHEHLAACPLCLEAFAVLLADDEVVPQRATARYLGLWREHANRKRAWFASRWSRVGALAAAACLVLSLGWWYHLTTRPVAVTMPYGLVVLNGEPLPPGGSTLPQGQTLDVPVVTRMVLGDGSQVDVEPGSRVALSTGLRGSVTMQLHEGEVNAHVSRQQVGHTFSVNTSLGRVTVVGTMFRVNVGRESVKVFESDAAGTSPRAYTDEIKTVQIVVTEGVVRVANAFEEVTLTANQQATLREGQNRIAVTDVQP